MTKSVTNWARSERGLLCDLFLDVGPDAPTLCAGWNTRDLAAHLAIRERRPDAAAGIVIPWFADYGEKVRKEFAGHDWPALVELVRDGPPHWSPMRIEIVDELTNTVEFFVHHEDVRRAAGDWQPRDLDDDFEHELWKAVRRGSRLMLRKAPGGVVLEWTGGDSVTAKKGDPSVTVRGSAGEIVEFCSGRQAHARVELIGPDDLADRLRTASLGI
jgi:uncharacterized protein (TIGR03085 family)